jgi:hypothetical protein
LVRRKRLLLDRRYKQSAGVALISILYMLLDLSSTAPSVTLNKIIVQFTLLNYLEKIILYTL